MKTYIYPECSKTTALRLLSGFRDLIIICAGIVLSVIVLVNLWNIIPFAVTACYAFVTVRADDMSIMDYLFNAVKFFVTSQQLYFWRKS